MKRKETAPSGREKEYVVPEWSTYEDRPTKRHGIENRVSNRDTSKARGDKFHTPLLLRSVTTLVEDEEHINGALIRGKDGV
jgi:hypothetical protein